jgi:CRP-like cAMP-binding protein
LVAPCTSLFLEGQSASEAFYLETGGCKLVRRRPDAGDVIVGLRSASQFLSADVVILGRPHLFSAVTLTTCWISRLSAGRFRDLVKSSPELSWYLHKLQSELLYMECGQIAELGGCSARDRLLHFLERLHTGDARDGNTADEVRIQVPLKQREIAQLLAIAPAYLCLLISQLEREGALRRESDSFILRRRLRRHTNGGAEALSART